MTRLYYFNGAGVDVVEGEIVASDTAMVVVRPTDAPYELWQFPCTSVQRVVLVGEVQPPIT